MIKVKLREKWLPTAKVFVKPKTEDKHPFIELLYSSNFEERRAYHIIAWSHLVLRSHEYHATNFLWTMQNIFHTHVSSDCLSFYCQMNACLKLSILIMNFSSKKIILIMNFPKEKFALKEILIIGVWHSWIWINYYYVRAMCVYMCTHTYYIRFCLQFQYVFQHPYEPVYLRKWRLSV